ncbi:UDP-2,3-diacylglucosamine diphosphatase LpxI [Rhodomicrobium sp. Az07]|uniref:LpxI family protein n=1 Tax=Rhodomicrobium sp. Az07 TaxID=2839034 RepID=UPI001BED34D3|nr:UDP-2,3-diacylglucosamine diphosphatase LpxI [Rhodomicrobium sp. Az07]MBT3071487.1 UDP-2,3-diacylglucosamine diphosphatase LpxI [Rhodomicrobium sp. Az07]
MRNGINASRIGIVAGGGTLPLAVAEAAAARGERPFIVGLSGNAHPAIERFPHCYAGIGQIGRILGTLRREGCERIVFVGSLRRPNLLRLRIDTGFVRYLPEILRLLRGGDDSVLRAVARFFEARGFEVLAAHEVAPRLLAPTGVFSGAAPDAEALADIRLAFNVARALGEYDIGQGAVVARGYVLAVEAAEGTDAMLTRCRDLNRWGFKNRQGVLVKTPKPGQDLRLDMPAIGPRTVELAAEAGLAGIAVAAGAVLLAEQQAIVEKADALGLFLYGMDRAE